MTDELLTRLTDANPIPATTIAELTEELRDQRLELPEMPHRSRARPALAAAAIVAALVAAPALALHFGVIDFSSAPPAPPKVVKEFGSLAVGAPPGMDPRVVAKETRQVGGVGGYTLWVAPTKAGGLCYEWAKTSGGCDSLGTVPLSVTWSGGSPGSPGATTPWATVVDGFAHSRWVDDVVVTLDDGTLVHPKIIWISKPIAAGFFRYHAPEGTAIREVAGLRHGHRVVADLTGSGELPGPHPFADLSKRKKVGEIPTGEGAATLWTAPTLTDGRCTWVEFAGNEIPAIPCLPKGYEHQAGLAFSVRSFGDRLVLVGECGYAAIQLTHMDGTTRRVPCSDGIVFEPLDSADAQGTMRPFGADGQPVGKPSPVPPPYPFRTKR